MALGIGKIGCKTLGIKIADTKRIERLATGSYHDWQDNRDEMQAHFPKTDRWLMQCHNMPKWDDMALNMFDEILDGFGVEAIEIEGQHIDNYYYNIVACYVNNGHTYQPTVLFDTDQQRFMVCSWGGFVESKGF